MHPFVLAAHRFLSEQSKSRIITITFVAIALLGWLDYWSGNEFTLSIFFLVPILISTWYVNLKTGYIISGISVIFWLVTNKLTGDAPFYSVFLYWNAIVRLLFFCLPSFLADQLKRALTNERMLAQTDPLTGVCNQRAFYRLAEIEISRSRRYAHPFMIAYLDIDNFKMVNDRLGHLAGDALLRDFARILTANLRQTDILARLGGDEFAILFPETGPEDARVVIHKLQAVLLEQWQFENLVQTVSIGVVTFPSFSGLVDEMLKDADRAMYSAKSLGRNRAYFQET